MSAVFKYVFATADAVLIVKGRKHSTTRGWAYHVDDPLVKTHPDCFTDQPLLAASTPGWEPPVDEPVEQATAGPGEKRTTRRAR
jgi:hypothetical protein